MFLRFLKNSKNWGLEIINSDSQLKNMNPDKVWSLDEILHSQEGLEDIGWLDMMTMDSQYNIWSTNGVLPKIFQNTLQSKIDESERQMAYFMSRLEAVGKAVDNIMPASNTVRGLAGKDYMSTFRRKAGKFLDTGLVRAESIGYSKKLSKARKYSHDVGGTKTNYTNSERIQNLWNFRKKNSIIVDMTQLQGVKDFIEAAYKDENSPFYNLQLRNEKGESVPIVDYFTKTSVETTEAFKKEANIKGEKYFDSIVEEQIENLTIFVENLKVIEDQDRANSFNASNNPFLYTEKHKSSNTFSETLVREPRAVSFLPNIENQDENFIKITENKDLYEFYTITKEVFNEMYNSLEPEDQANFDPMDIGSLEKTMRDRLLTKGDDITWQGKIGDFFRELLERLKAIYTIKVQNYATAAKVNPVTNKPIYKVKSGFFISNKKKISDEVYHFKILQWFKR